MEAVAKFLSEFRAARRTSGPAKVGPPRSAVASAGASAVEDAPRAEPLPEAEGWAGAETERQADEWPAETAAPEDVTWPAVTPPPEDEWPAETAAPEDETWPVAPVGVAPSWPPAPVATAPDPQPDSEPPRRPRGSRLKERAAFGAAIAVVAAALGLLAVHNDDAASRWRSLDAAQAAQTARAVRQVQAANSNISTLNSEVKSLDGQISTMQSQLSDAANQKEKAIDQTTLFKQLLSAAGQVADNLESCITASNTLNADIANAVAANNPGAFNGLLQEASYVQQTCQAAQAGNNALQQAIQSAS
ncbi:MAG TPA: hypothetical protein VKU88_11020 [Acidimicrobiales bacterium]|nr:hypothetical protein [Acidimicrobiales bacterium]